MKLFLILSRSIRDRVPKSGAAALVPAHREYHTPVREKDSVLLQAMIRPDANTSKGSRCMIMQAETLEEVQEFVSRNPLVEFDAMEWSVQELLPNYAAEGVRAWFQGQLPQGHH